MNFENININDNNDKPDKIRWNINKPENLPNWSDWSFDDRWNKIIESWEIEYFKILDESKKLRSNLIENLNLPNINWITLKKQENVSSNGTLNWVKKVRLDELIHWWQKLSITKKNWNKINIVWWKSNKWEQTYLIEWTNKRVTINDWDKIQPYDKKINDINNDFFEKTDWFKPPIVSAPTYKNERWITLCSKTARENLTNLWCKDIKQWSSAKKSFEQYWKKAETFPPKNNWAKIFDLYMDASPKNREYWHRAIWVKIDGEWKVLDPYYNWTRNPVSAESYLAKMRWKWRKIWGWFSVW